MHDSLNAHLRDCSCRRIFDLYEGEKIGSGEKALAFRICYRSKDRTLAGKEINQLHEAIIAQIRQETGGRLREG